MIDITKPDASSAITTAALNKSCDDCVKTVGLFIGALGAEAGNIALRTLSTGGIFIGGGIAPKIIPLLENGAFIKAFTDKPPYESLLKSIPVKVILNTQAALIGAAVFANDKMK